LRKTCEKKNVEKCNRNSRVEFEKKKEPKMESPNHPHPAKKKKGLLFGGEGSYLARGKTGLR